VGRAAVELQVVVPHWHTRGQVARGARLADGDLVEARHALPRGGVKRPLSLEALVDGRVLADLAADACLTSRVVAPSPAVVAGREVAAVVRLGGLEVRADLVAVDSGSLGADVRVMHPASRKTFRARVIGRAQVEISHEP
jgi:flagella basal body P-ring formation protein FlgA